MDDRLLDTDGPQQPDGLPAWAKGLTGVLEKNCIFCQKKNVKVVDQTSRAMLVRSLGEHNDWLILPKVHYTSWLELPFVFLGHMQELTRSIPGFDAHGDHNVSLNQGYVAGQRLAHIHWHIIDRANGSTSNLGLATLARQ